MMSRKISSGLCISRIFSTVLLLLPSSAVHTLALSVCGSSSSDCEEFRNYDGSGNNQRTLAWGTSGSSFSQLCQRTAAFGSANGLGPREISVLSGALPGTDPSLMGSSELSSFFGLFITHDLTQLADSGSASRITVPACDAEFDVGCFGGVTIAYNLSTKDQNGKAVNQATSYLDLSHIYGTNLGAANKVRSFNDGKLQTVCDPVRGEEPPRSADRFVWTDRRINSHPVITALYTLFIREHNRLAVAFKADNPQWEDELIYQQSRKFNIALFQHIVVDEYLPILLNGGKMAAYRGYNYVTNPAITGSFFALMTASIHSQLNPSSVLLSSEGIPVGPGGYSLTQAWDRPELVGRVEMEAALLGATRQKALQAALPYKNEVRSQKPNSTNFHDWFAEDIMLTRELGICPLNDLRRSLSLTPYSAFSALGAAATFLQQSYQTIEDVEIAVGSLLEGTSSGIISPTMSKIVIEQFQRLRDGDRFWFESDALSSSWKKIITATRLSHLIGRNFALSMGEDVMYAPDSAGDVAMPLQEDMIDNKRYDFSIQLHPLYNVRWTIDKQTSSINVQLMVMTTGWVGFGFGGTGHGMAGADIVFGSVQNGQVQLSDGFALTEGLPSLDATLGGKSDLSNVLGVEMDGATLIRFTRKLDTQDTISDVVISNSALRAVWAFGISDSLSHHGYHRGTKAINFLTGLPSIPPVVSWISDRYYQVSFENGLFTLRWKLQKGAILFEIGARTAGWVSIGFSYDGTTTMRKVDIALARPINGSQYELLDMYSLAVGPPLVDPPSRGGANNLKLISSSMQNGMTTIIFQRGYDASDPFDLPIRGSPVNILWAMGSSDIVNYHGLNRRGRIEINMLRPRLSDTSGILGVGNVNAAIADVSCKKVALLPRIQIHITLMLWAWGVLAPIGIAFGMMGHNFQKSAIIHMVLMFLASVLTISAEVFIMVTNGIFFSAHAILGGLIAILLMTQAAVGVGIVQGKLGLDVKVYLPILQMAHRYLGCIVWLSAQVNIFVGMLMKVRAHIVFVIVYAAWISIPLFVFIYRIYKIKKTTVVPVDGSHDSKDNNFGFQFGFVASQKKAEFHQKRIRAVKSKALKSSKSVDSNSMSDNSSVSSGGSSKSTAKTKYTAEEVAKHDKETDCWVILNNTVLDVTQFMNEHPGGKDKLLNYAGKDVSKEFMAVGHSTFALKMVGWYEMGVVKKAKKKTFQEEDIMEEDDEDLEEESIMLGSGSFVCQTTDLGEGKMTRHEINGTSFLLSMANGRVIAFEELCPHQKAPLSAGVLDGTSIICPWHGAKFSCTTGDVEEAPSLRKLLTHAVLVRGTQVYVELREPPPLTYFTTYNRSKDQRTVVLIGAGAAAVSCADQLRMGGYQGRLIMITKENVLPYDRTWLSKGLGLGMKHEHMVLQNEHWFEERDIEFMRGLEVTEVNTTDKMIKFHQAPPLRYDMAMVCTGGRPRKLTCPGHNLRNVCYFRTHADQQKLEHLASSEKDVVIVGGGFIAMEIGSCLALICKSVTQVVKYGYPMHILGPLVGDSLQRMHEENGVKFACNAEVKELKGEHGFVTAVVLSDGRIIPTTLVIVAIGIEPCTEMLADVTLLKDKSVEVDGCMRVKGAVSLWAAGDIATYPVSGKGKVRNEHWKTALQQGTVAARSMLDPDGVPTEFKIGHIFWSVQFGRNLRFAGYGINVHDDAAGKVIPVIEGKLEELKMIVYYVRGQELLGVLTCAMDPIASIAAELFKEHTVPAFTSSHIENPREYTKMLLTKFNSNADLGKDQMPPTDNALQRRKTVMDEVTRLGGQIPQSTPAGQTTQPSGSETPGSPAGGDGAPGALTWAEVGKHVSQSDCWVVINGEVLDVTAFLEEHPGGRDVIFRFAGKDASPAFEAKNHSKFAKSMLL